MYSEMLFLYKIILESKRDRSKHGTIQIKYKKEKRYINRYGWLYRDMEEVLKERFPNLTLEKIDELLEKESKFGRKSKDLYILIWGVYHLMKNHHSAFKDSDTKVISAICKFSLDYIEFLNIPNELYSDNIIDYFKKTDKPSTWEFAWNSTPSYSSIEEYIIQEKIK